MRALVVGGAGFLGANMVRTLLAAGARVTVLDSLEPALRASTANLEAVLDRITFVKGDMRDAAVLAEVLPGHDTIFQCAGQTSHPISMKQPAFDADLNCGGNLSLLEGVRMHAADAVFVYVSTSTVIGRAVRSPIDETHPANPLDIYSANKLSAEHYCRIYHRVHGLKTIALRFPNLYGPYGKGYPEFGFVNYFIHLGLTDQEIRIFGEGQQMRNLVYVRDACEAMLAAAREPRLHGEMAFAAHDEHLSVRDIAATIVEVFGRGRVTHVEWPEERRRIEVDDVHISGQKLRGVVGWAPKYTFAQGLVEVLHANGARE